MPEPPSVSDTQEILLMLTAFYSRRNKLQIKIYVRQVDSKGSLRSHVLAHSHRVGEGVVVVL